MISHNYELVFIHIPKCAGSSIEEALGHNDGFKGRNSQDHRSIRMLEHPFPSISAFSSKRNIKESLRRTKYSFKKLANPNNKLTLTREQYKNYFKFTFVRNPWTRCFSWYRNVIRDEQHLIRYNINADISFEEFLTRFIGQGMLRPQIYWLQDFKGNIPMDFIGKFESLAKDFRTLCGILSLGSIELPHKIKGQTTDYQEFYNSKLIDLVYHTYRKEINLFDYQYESDYVPDSASTYLNKIS